MKLSASIYWKWAHHSAQALPSSPATGTTIQRIWRAARFHQKPGDADPLPVADPDASWRLVLRLCPDNSDDFMLDECITQDINLHGVSNSGQSLWLTAQVSTGVKNLDALPDEEGLFELKLALTDCLSLELHIPVADLRALGVDEPTLGELGGDEDVAIVSYDEWDGVEVQLSTHES